LGCLFLSLAGRFLCCVVLALLLVFSPRLLLLLFFLVAPSRIIWAVRLSSGLALSSGPPFVHHFSVFSLSPVLSAASPSYGLPFFSPSVSCPSTYCLARLLICFLAVRFSLVSFLICIPCHWRSFLFLSSFPSPKRKSKRGKKKKKKPRFQPPWLRAPSWKRKRWTLFGENTNGVDPFFWGSPVNVTLPCPFHRKPIRASFGPDPGTKETVFIKKGPNTPQPGKQEFRPKTLSKRQPRPG